MTEKERQEFLAEPHIGVLSVAVGNDRPPYTTPVWYGYEPVGSITLLV
jgi:nitroimidazol reductase NimA-like FMN-containing flavoprotein (pyridoxamine 5'-phosphate oxidase superfamily)